MLLTSWHTCNPSCKWRISSINSSNKCVCNGNNSTHPNLQKFEGVCIIFSYFFYPSIKLLVCILYQLLSFFLRKWFVFIYSRCSFPIWRIFRFPVNFHRCQLGVGALPTCPVSLALLVTVANRAKAIKACFGSQKFWASSMRSWISSTTWNCNSLLGSSKIFPRHPGEYLLIMGF